MECGGKEQKERDGPDRSRYILNQVWDVNTKALVKAAKLDKSSVPLTYPRYANVRTTRITVTLADQASGHTRG
ncbi:hypothetical protein [Clavibacter michiganensis]|uniref:hypothetical protein n=1 Tax=Clavibacter michiganensis TaxID=28447 RepID=UPI00293063D2|nr:hypothetical protein [Clavibacter michiganensis]